MESLLTSKLAQLACSVLVETWKVFRASQVSIKMLLASQLVNHALPVTIANGFILCLRV